VGVQRKRPAVGKSPQVAALNAALVSVAFNGFQKSAPPVQAAVAALDVHGRSRFAKLSIHYDSKVKIAPVHSDF
jgi:hypothetical protein